MNKKLIGVVIAAIVVVAAAIFGILTLRANKPKNVFMKNIDNTYEKFSSYLKELEKIKTVSATADVSFDFNIGDALLENLSESDRELIEEIKKLNFSVETKADIEKKLMALDLNAKYKTDSLINASAYIKNNAAYIYLKDIYDKYIEVPFDDSVSNINVNVADVEYIITTAKNAIFNSINEDDFEKDSETITIDGKDVKTTKLTYALSEKKLDEIALKTLKTLRDDSKFLDKLASISGLDKDELKLQLNKAIDNGTEAVKSASTKTEAKFIMYTTGMKNEAIRYVLKSDYMEISYTDYKGTIKLVAKDEDKTVLTFTMVENSKESYTTEFVADPVKVNINSKKSGDTWNHEFKLSESQSKLDISGTLAITEKEITKDKNYDYEVKLTVAVSVSGVKAGDGTITLKGNVKYNDEITLPDTSNSVLYTDLTESQLETIRTNLMKNETLVGLIERFSLNNSLVENNKYDYYDDYNYYDDDDDYNYDYDDYEMRREDYNYNF